MAHGAKHLISCRRRGTGSRPARDDVNPARDRRCAKTVSRRRHARMAAPAVAPGIVGFRLVEGTGGGLAPPYAQSPPQPPPPATPPPPGPGRPALPPAPC